MALIPRGRALDFFLPPAARNVAAPVVLMVLLLKRLHAASVVRFHESKTNGDYVFEFPRSRAERAEFRQFVGLFDGTIYGAAECDQGLYRRMKILFEACLSHVR
jgi:hypothetical protein